jgi:hypothetical protein
VHDRRRGNERARTQYAFENGSAVDIHGYVSSFEQFVRDGFAPTAVLRYGHSHPGIPKQYCRAAQIPSAPHRRLISGKNYDAFGGAIGARR